MFSNAYVESSTDGFMENHLLQLRSNQSPDPLLRSQAPEKDSSPTSLNTPSQILFDRLPPAHDDPRDDEFLAASIALDQRHLKATALPLLQEDFVNILALRNEIKIKCAHQPKDAKTQLKTKGAALKCVQPQRRLVAVSKKVVAKDKNSPAEDKKSTNTAKQRSVWRNYPKPWLHGISKQQAPAKSNQQPETGLRRKQTLQALHPLPPIPQFILDNSFPSEKQTFLERKTSAQMMIQKYEERQPSYELTYEEAVTRVANSKPSRASNLQYKQQGNSQSDIFHSSGEAVIDEILERQLEQDPYVNALSYHQRTQGFLPPPSELRSTKILIAPLGVETEPEKDINGNPICEHVLPNSDFEFKPGNNQVHLRTNAGNSVQKTARQIELTQRQHRFEESDSCQRQSQGNRESQLHPNRVRAYQMAQKDPEMYTNFRLPQYPMIQPLMRPFAGNFLWDGRIHQSNSSMASGTLPLYQLNYFPEIHEQFPPPLHPKIWPPRAPTAHNIPAQRQQSGPPQARIRSHFLSDSTDYLSFQPENACSNGLSHAPRPVFTTQQAVKNIDPRVNLQSQTNTFFNVMPKIQPKSHLRRTPLMCHPQSSHSDYPSNSSFQLPNAPPPTQQRQMPHPLIYSDHSIPYSDFTHFAATDPRIGQQYMMQELDDSLADFNGNVYSSKPVPWEIPFWSSQSIVNPNPNLADLYNRNHFQTKFKASQATAEDEIERFSKYEPPNNARNGQTRERPLQRKGRQGANNNYMKPPSKIHQDVPAQSKVNCGSTANKPHDFVPASVSISLPTCFTDMDNYIGIQEELELLGKLRQDLYTPRSHSADSSCASIRVLLSSRKLQAAKLPKRKVPERALANVKHYGHKLCPCFECRRAHGLYANDSHSMSSLEQVDYVRKNIEDLKKYKNVVRNEQIVFVDTPKGDKIPPLITFAGRKGYGKIPGYLIKRKEEIERERRFRLLEEEKKATVEAEQLKQEENRRQFHRMERRRAAAKANFCLYRTHLESERPKWNPLEPNPDSNYNCFLYVNGKVQSELFRVDNTNPVFTEAGTTGPGPAYPNMFNLDLLPDNLKPQKKPLEDQETVSPSKVPPVDAIPVEECVATIPEPEDLKILKESEIASVEIPDDHKTEVVKVNSVPM